MRLPGRPIQAVISDLAVHHGLTIEQAGRLTLWQVNNVYGYPRDERGECLPAAAGSTDRAGLMEGVELSLRKRGLKDWMVQRRLKQLGEARGR